MTGPISNFFKDYTTTLNERYKNLAFVKEHKGQCETQPAEQLYCILQTDQVTISEGTDTPEAERIETPEDRLKLQLDALLQQYPQLAEQLVTKEEIYLTIDSQRTKGALNAVISPPRRATN